MTSSKKLYGYKTKIDALALYSECTEMEKLIKRLSRLNKNEKAYLIRLLNQRERQIIAGGKK